MSTANPDTVIRSLEKETRRKRRLIESSFWPRARLFFEILISEIKHTHTFSQAAALTYKTLFSLLPVCVLSLLVLSTISSGSNGTALDAVVQRMIFKQLSLEKLKLHSADGEEVKGPDGHAVTAQEMVSPLIDRAKQEVTRPTTGIIAFAILLYGSISLMIVIESTFNLVYGAVKPRSWPRRIMLYWCVLTLGPIALAVSAVFGRSAYNTASTLAGRWVIGPSNLIAGFAMSWILVLLMYKLIPDTRVNWRSSLIGSLVAAFLWELSKWGFSLYVNHALTHSWYGSLVLIPLFMLWIYLTWAAILLGLQVAYMHQFYPLLRRRYFFTRVGASVIADVHWVLALAVILFQRFQAGKGLHPQEAAELLMLPNETAGQLLEGLQSAGLVHTTRTDSYALARPAESITAHDLLTAARVLCQAPPELMNEAAGGHVGPTTPALRELDGLVTQWAKSRTLADLAAEA